MTAEVDNFLEHYGVKGMHWGKHKSSAGSTVEKSGGSSKEAAGKGKIDKAELKVERKKIYDNVKTHMKQPAQKVSTGAAIATSLFTGGATGSAVIGAQMMRGAGFSKGKSFTTAMLGGAPGAMLMIELQARKNVRAAHE